MLLCYETIKFNSSNQKCLLACISGFPHKIFKTFRSKINKKKPLRKCTKFANVRPHINHYEFVIFII